MPDFDFEKVRQTLQQEQPRKQPKRDDPGADGDMRIVKHPKYFPPRYEVQWYGTVDNAAGCSTGWRTARGFGDEGFFPSEELATEAILGSFVVKKYSRAEVTAIQAAR